MKLRGRRSSRLLSAWRIRFEIPSRSATRQFDAIRTDDPVGIETLASTLQREADEWQFKLDADAVRAFETAPVYACRSETLIVLSNGVYPLIGLRVSFHESITLVSFNRLNEGLHRRTWDCEAKSARVVSLKLRRVRVG